MIRAVHLLARCYVFIPALVSVIFSTGSKGAETLKTLYRFCPDIYCHYGGAMPQSNLVMDSSGNIYGVTTSGGRGAFCNIDRGCGVIFKLSFDISQKKWKGSVLYDFCSRKLCIDGVGSPAGLLIDKSGALYGAAYFGSKLAGAIFRLNPDAGGKKWTETILYNFRSQVNDSAAPISHLVMDARGNLYGTAGGGGASDVGTVFELSPNSTKTKWTETILYNFCSKSQCVDGDAPFAGVVRDPSSGDLYGTTAAGGVYSRGTIFKLSREGRGWSYKVLHNFCSMRGCVDGYPNSESFNAGLTLDPSGNLYGTTSAGGASPSGGGAVFKLTPNPAKTKWSYQVIYSFCSLADCIDGELPPAGVIESRSGHLFGTSRSGGANGWGTVFQLTPPAAGNRRWQETVLYSFCSQTGCADGAGPLAGVIIDRAGDLYGTTAYLGGSYIDGTVFELER